MRTMALDFGEKRVGVAVTDPTGSIAQPLETVERKTAYARISELVGEYEVDRIVVGLPLHMDGRSGPEAQRARAFGDEVARRTGIAVDYLDERWTSREAERAMGPSGRSERRRSKKRTGIDPVAAALLLSTYLERER